MDKLGESPAARQQIELLSSFYGVGVETISIGTVKDERRVTLALGQKTILAAVITAGALPFLDHRKVMAYLRRGNGKSIPLLIFGVTEETDAAVLKRWSGGAVISCVGPIEIPSGTMLFVRTPEEITRQLAGQTVPLAREKVCGLVADNSRDSDPIVRIRSAGSELSVMVRVLVGTRQLFFASASEPSDKLQETKLQNSPAAFAPLAPLLMFVRYAAGDRAWHSVGHYANLTVDDVWLADPYGNFSFQGILPEMLKHNFHTTVALIPWNFDRSQPDVVTLIRAHPDRFSICVHGNNHAHVEFGDYKNYPLSGQISNIRQAIARMEKFKDLTGLPYDRVFIFPHEVMSPWKTLSAFKEYNFLAAANSVNVPMGEQAPNTPLFALRAVTLAFANFPSLRRYYAGAPASRPWIAIQAFLDEPVLFYAHSDLFVSGMGAFDGVADAVNEIDPGTRWCSLGDIMRHLYLVKLRDDGNYDVETFSSDISLDNVNDRDATFYLQKEEDFSPPIRAVAVDGRPFPYTRSGRYLSCVVPVPAGGSRHLAITYENDLNLASIDISKPSLRINLLRKFSDFRDMTLSRNAVGRILIHLYYGSGVSGQRGIKLHFIPVTLSVLVLMVLARSGWSLQKRMKSRNAVLSLGLANAKSQKPPV